MNCYGRIINIVPSVLLLRIFQNGEMVNIVLHIQELWSTKNENVHVLKLLKAERLPTLFYMSKNCCETVPKQVGGVTNIVLLVPELLCYYSITGGPVLNKTGRNEVKPPGSFEWKSIRLPFGF